MLTAWTGRARPLGFAAVVLTACQQATPSDGSRSPASRAAAGPVDDLTDLDGTTIGTPASSIADLGPVGPFSAVLRKLNKPRPVLGVPADAADYNIVDDAFAGATWKLPIDACDKLVATVSARIGAPERSGPGSDWTGARLELHINRTTLGCLVAYGKHVLFDPNASFGPHTSAAPRFGGVQLGAPFASFKDLALRERDGKVAWYEPRVKRYGTFELSRLTYEFQDDRLTTISFETANLQPCAPLFHDLQTALGPSIHLPGLGGGTQDTWKGNGDSFTFKFNQSEETCGGILFEGTNGLGP